MTEEKFELCCWCGMSEHPQFDKMEDITTYPEEVYEKAKRCHWTKLDAINEGAIYMRKMEQIEKNKKELKTLFCIGLLLLITVSLAAIASSLG